MKDNTFFSIIIPTYNRAFFILKTLNSVLNQTYPYFEIIVVDDGSTDSTERLIKNINSKKIKYFKIKNSERGAARNYGTLHAIGSYVTFLDSDDILLPDHFSNAQESILKYHHPPFLHLGYEIVGSNNKILFRINYLKNDSIDFLIRGNSLSCIGCFIRVDIAKEYLFNEDRELSGSEDWELWLRILANFGIKIDKRVSARMFNHEDRSVVVEAEEQSLSLRMNLTLKYAFQDKKVQQYFGKFYGQMNAFAYSYIALHLALLSNFKKSIFFVFKFLINYPPGIFSRRFLVIVKHILLSVVTRRQQIFKYNGTNGAIPDDELEELQVILNTNYGSHNSYPIKINYSLPLVSIIIPCYNAEKYILQTVHSILLQSYTNFEILFINDGSTDNTENIIREIKDGRIRCYNKANTGVSDSRNMGLELAKGDYVLFLDADDILSKHFIQKRVEFLLDNKFIGFCCSLAMKIDEDGNIVSNKTWRGPSSNIIQEVLSYSTDIITCPSNYLFRKDILKSNAVRYSTDLSSSADRYFLIELANFTKGRMITNGGYLYYRVHKESMSNTVTLNLLNDTIKFQKKILKLRNIPIELKRTFCFRTNFIFAGSYLKLNKILLSIGFSIKAFYYSPVLFFKQIIHK
jgi:glycosyltransferase involved in cell wall biosynthesis